MRLKPMLAPVLVVLLAACGGDGPSGPAAEEEDVLAGFYPLVTLAGDSLPYLADEQGPVKLEVVGGSVTLRADGTFTDVIDLRVTNGTSVTRPRQQATGTYTLTGNVLTFTSTTVEPYTMVRDGATLTQDVDGFVWVYRKE